MAGRQKPRLTQRGAAATIASVVEEGIAMPETAPLKAFWQPG